MTQMDVCPGAPPITAPPSAPRPGYVSKEIAARSPGKSKRVAHPNAGKPVSIRAILRRKRAVTRSLKKKHRVPRTWPEAWWCVARLLLVRGPETITAGKVLRLAMRLVGMGRDCGLATRLVSKGGDRGEYWLEEIEELAASLALTNAHVAALLDDTAWVDAETAALLMDRTGVPVTYWLDLRRCA